MAFDQVKYTNEYQKDNYDRLSLLIPKGKKQVVKAYADKRKMTITQVFVEAVEHHCKLDLSTKPEPIDAPEHGTNAKL